MRQFICLLIALLLVAPALAAAATVQISPDYPGDTDALSCDVTSSTSKFYYQWFQNSVKSGSQLGPTNSAVTQSAAGTNSGDQWMCAAYEANCGLWCTKGDMVGSDTVSISGSVTPPTPGNNPPQWSSWAADVDSCALQQTVSIYLSASDPDGDSVIYSSTSELNIQPCATNGLWQFFPDCSKLGNHQVTFTATDSHGASVSQTITVAVSNCNNVCNPQYPVDVTPKVVTKEICAEKPFEQLFTVSYDGPFTVRSYLSRKPDTATYGQTTDDQHYAFRWTPSRMDIGTVYQFTAYFEAYDYRCKYDMDFATVDLKIIDCSNKCPTITQAGDQKTCIGKPFSFTPSGSDAENDKITWSIVSGPNWLSIDSSTGRVYGTPTVAAQSPVTIRATDGKPGCGNTMTFKIIAEDCNKCPYISPITDLYNQCIGSVVGFQIYASDANSDPITWRFVGDSRGATLSSTGYFRWVPTQAGTYTFTVEASDNKPGCCVTKTFTVTVIDCNKCPTITQAGDQSACLNKPFSFTPSGMDENNDPITWSLVNNPPGWLSIDPSTGRVYGTPSATGTFTVTIKATDGKPGCGNTMTFRIVVTDCNRCPKLDYIYPQEECVGGTVRFTAHATDADGNSLTYSIENSPGGAIDRNSGAYVWTNAQKGLYNIKVKVSDGSSNCDVYQLVQVTVKDCNKCAWLDDVPDVTKCEGGLVSFKVNGHDADNDQLYYTVQGMEALPNTAYFDPNTGQFNWQTVYCNSGTYHLTFCVWDKHTECQPDCDSMIIQINDCYNCPTIDPIQDITKCAGEQVYFKANGRDLDGDRLTYSITGKPDGASFNTQTGELTWNSQVSNSGTFNMNVCVSDNTQFCPQPVCTPVKVTLNNCNKCPYISPITDLYNQCIGSVVGFQISASDANNDPITWRIVGDSRGAVVSSSGYFSWTPAQAGTYTFTVEATDNKPGCCVTKTFTVTVIDCNKCPTITQAGDQSACINRQFSFTPTATDENNDPITWSIVNNPGWLSIDPSTGRVYGTPSATGTFTVTLKATDGKQGCCATMTFKIVVTDCNKCPTLDYIYPQEVCIGGTVRFTAHGTDVDGNALTYSIENAPTGATIDRNTGAFSWTPSQIGLYNIKVKVNDGNVNCNVYQLVQVTVKDCNTCAWLDDVPDVTKCEGGLVSFKVNGHDADGEKLYYTVQGMEALPNTAYFDPNTGQFNWQTVYCNSGTYHLTFCVWDKHTECQPDCDSMIIQINDCYNCPTIAPIPDITKCAGEQVSFKANGQDLDGDSLTYTITGKPEGASFTTQTGQFTWNSQVSNSGTFNMNVCVSDNTQFCPQPVCTPVKVTLNNCNDCPVVQPVDIKKVCEEDVIEFYLSASDADNDRLTYSIIGTLPTGATFDSSTGHFYWQTHICNSGDYNLQWCASDGQCTRCAPLNIEVIDCWEPPKACFTYQPSSPKCGETITFDASCSSDPKGLALNYQWDFNGDGVIDATGVTATYTPNCEQCDGCFNAKLTVSNSYFADTESKQVCIGAGEQLEVEGITCFPVVIQHSLQSCSVTLTEKIGDVQITLKDKVTDEVLGTCQTDRLTGACTDNFPRDVLGQFEVYATAQKTGYTGDNDETPAYPYIVIAERYEIEDLKVYNEQNYQTEDYDFYRAENMYVKFLVRDKTTGQCTTDVITEADLVSPPGGRAQLSQFKAPEGCYYYYWLNIPPTHGFLGVSQVFTFAFNFEDQTGGEAYVDLTIRNNLPQIEPVVPSQTMIQGTCAEYNLASHKHDIEDSGDDLRWEASGIGSGFTVSINGDTMKVCALQSGSAQFTLKLFDLDNDFDSQQIGAEGGDNKLPPISNPNGPYRYLEGQEIQLSSSGSRDPDGGAIVSYSWQFGDGQVSNLANPKHVYANNGTYLVTLTVTDDEGVSAKATTHAYISLPVEPDKTLYRDDLFVKHLEVNANNIVKKGDKEITVRATIENRGELDVKNMELTLMVRELGLQQTFRHIRLDSDEAINKYVRFINPGIPGKYTIMLHLATESGIERTKFVEFEVI